MADDQENTHTHIYIYIPFTYFILQFGLLIRCFLMIFFIYLVFILFCFILFVIFKKERENFLSLMLLFKWLKSTLFGLFLLFLAWLVECIISLFWLLPGFPNNGSYIFAKSLYRLSHVPAAKIPFQSMIASCTFKGCGVWRLT